MTASQTGTSLAVCLPLFFVTACGPQPSGQARVRLRLDLPVEGVQTKSGDARPIEDTPLVLWASIDASDISSPATAQWSGRIDQTPSVELTVEAGTNRVLSVFLLSLNDERVESFRGLQTGLELAPGDHVVSIELERSPEWTLVAHLVPDGPVPAQAAVMEAQTRIRFPPAELKEDQGAWSVTIEHLPQGRFFYLVVRNSNGSWSDPLTGCPIWSAGQKQVTKTFSLVDGSCNL